MTCSIQLWTRFYATFAFSRSMPNINEVKNVSNQNSPANFCCLGWGLFRNFFWYFCVNYKLNRFLIVCILYFFTIKIFCVVDGLSFVRDVIFYLFERVHVDRCHMKYRLCVSLNWTGYGIYFFEWDLVTLQRYK